MRVCVDDRPFPLRKAGGLIEGRGPWPVHWISFPRAPAARFVTAYRLRVSLAEPIEFQAAVSGADRYELFVDGVRVGRGPERGDLLHWFYETYAFQLAPGERTVVARVWSLGDASPLAQLSAPPGFLFAPLQEELLDVLATGRAPWKARALTGYRFIESHSAWRTGCRVAIDGAQFPWGYETGEGSGWETAAVRRPAYDELTGAASVADPLLLPAALPPMLERETTAGIVRYVAKTVMGDVSHNAIQAAEHLPDEAARWQELLRGGAALTIAPSTNRRVLIDLADYTCAYHEIETSGGCGSTVRILWQEALFVDERAQAKGNRNEIEGKFFIDAAVKCDGVGDVFRPDGGRGRRFTSLWWHAGRFVELLVSTADEPLTIAAFVLRETRYPLEVESRLAAKDPGFARFERLAVRTLQMCAHETYMDCPYYEQLMYIGDTRIAALMTYVLTRDDRLPRKALRMFAWSRLPNGLTTSRYPCRERQTIPPFSLWWIGMVHDFMMWRGDMALMPELLPVVRSVLDCFLDFRGTRGLVRAMPGWNFLDWVGGWPAAADGWPEGVPPGGEGGANASFNWQTVIALREGAAIEDWCGEAELAARYRRHAGEIERSVEAAFWNEERGLFAETPAHEHYSEHAQCLALLAGGLSAERRECVAAGLLTAPDLVRTTV